MAKNITIAGVSYQDVPGVILNTTEGGEAKFVDTSGDTIIPEALFSGYTAHGKDGEEIVGKLKPVLYTPQELTEEEKAQARENIGAAETTPTHTATYNNGDTVELNNVQSLVLHGKTRTEDSKNLCSLNYVKVACVNENYFDFDIEEIPAGESYAVSAQIESNQSLTSYTIICLDASGNTVFNAPLSMTYATDERRCAVWLSAARPFCKLRIFAGNDTVGSLGITTIYSDLQIEAANWNTSYEPYYKAGDGIPAEVSFGDTKFSADAELFDGDSLNFANGSLIRNDGTASTIQYNGNISTLNGEYQVSSSGTVTITTAQAQPYVRYDSQTLTPEQQKQARANIGVDGFDCEAWGLPILRLTGSTEGMTKENAVTLNYEYGERSGTCSVKWQGGSSIALGEKVGGKYNFTIKFDNAFEAYEGWGEQKKYCTKANVIDHSHARNLLSAKLWGQIVKSRSNVPTNLSGLVNGGAVDGFPCIITLNEEFHGLYTFNIPKDAWMFGMGSGTQEAIICADKWVDATGFKASALVDGSDFELEYVTDEDNAGWVATSLNRLINACINTDGTDLDTTIAQYLDWQSAIDYYIFTVLLSGHDMTRKNYILDTFDGVKWYFSAYDLDSTYGLLYDGSAWLSADWSPNFVSYASEHRVMELIKTYKKDALKARYNTLRNTVLSESNVATVLNNFTGKIPNPVFMQDAKKWPLLPNTSTSNAAQIRDYYRMRVAYADKWMEQL